MKYTFAELKAHYASKRGFATFTDMKAEQQVSAPTQINQILEAIDALRPGVFGKDRHRIMTVAALDVTVSGTGGQRTITFGSSVDAQYSGVPTIPQLLVIGAREYRLIYRRSGTVWTIDSPLVGDLSSATAQIVFDIYPLPFNVGGIEGIKIENISEPISFVPELLVSVANELGTPTLAYAFGIAQSAYLNSGTVDVTSGSNQFVYSGTVSVDDIGHTLLLKVANKYELFLVVDAVTSGGAGVNYYVVDRVFNGTTATGVSFELSPVGTPLIAFHPRPTTSEIIEISYTRKPRKLVNDNDMTPLMSDIPVTVGIEAVATAWEDAGASNINEVLFKDKQFKASLNALNFRGKNLQNRLYSQADLAALKRVPRWTNPWNGAR